MCWQCDHPEADPGEYIEQVRETISHHGWAVQQVERDGIHPPWAYTVGLTEWDRPEIVITGIRTHGGWIPFLNAVAEHVRHAEAPAPGTQVRWIDGPFTEFVRVTVPDAHLNMAVLLYGPRIQALQVVHADDRGHWPWDKWYRGVRGGQPVLGQREPEDRRVLIE